MAVRTPDAGVAPQRGQAPRGGPPGEPGGAKLRVLFVSYSVAPRPEHNTAMMGVLKRCLRLIAQLPGERVQPWLLNFGELPHRDPLLQTLRQRFPRLLIDPCAWAPGCPEDLSWRPDVVVLGEGPGGGAMQQISGWATAAGIPQVGIENYYGARQVTGFLRDSPSVGRWLLLGLPEAGTFGRRDERVALAPPLLAPAREDSDSSTDLLVLAYDPHVVKWVEALLPRLPDGLRIQMLGPPTAPPGLVARLRRGQKLQFANLPGEQQYRGLLAGNRIVVCKNGFQQMAEALAVGTPVLAVAAPGGVPEAWLAAHLRPFIRFFPSGDDDWSRVISAVGLWLACRPAVPWQRDMAAIAHPARQAASYLLELLGEVTRPDACRCRTAKRT